jgi:prepilin-type N-terminal cleavage/methylation domain-containing protein
MEKGEAKPRRANERGVTLIEVLIVVAFLGLISGAIGAAVFERLSAGPDRKEGTSDDLTMPEIRLTR